jgi:hypothetical protein
MLGSPNTLTLPPRRRRGEHDSHDGQLRTGQTHTITADMVGQDRWMLLSQTAWGSDERLHDMDLLCALTCPRYTKVDDGCLRDNKSPTASHLIFVTANLRAPVHGMNFYDFTVVSQKASAKGGVGEQYAEHMQRIKRLRSEWVTKKLEDFRNTYRQDEHFQDWDGYSPTIMTSAKWKAC